MPEPGSARSAEAGPWGIALRVRYDGTGFQGFQKQPGKRTVQGALESALLKVCHGPVRAHGAGRTDAGVHATGQVVSFRSPVRVPTDRWPRALNSHLPADVSVAEAWAVPEGFHARYSATSREYRYSIVTGLERHPLLGRFAWVLPGPLDAERMSRTARLLVGCRDFRPYGLARPEEPTVRDLRRLEVRCGGARLLIILEANSYLRSMARYLVAALVAVGQETWPIERPAEILESGVRPRAFRAAPPHGLCLSRVSYAAAI